jgi:nitrite reductase/ring-hydroxylating ferredoxin subunit
MTAAYIGGHLVFGKQIGVHHAALIEGPDDFTPVVAESELEPDRPRLAEVGGERFVLVRHGGGVYALAETCSHLGGPLAQGTLEDGGIVCPWHASRFNLGDGRVLDGPATFAQPCFAVRIRDGQLEVGPRQR